jgi:RNA polymerase sigma-70 factor, ECF subfamily
MATGSNIVNLFMERLDPSLRARMGAPETLEPSLRNAIAESRAAWPGVDVSDEEFLAHVAVRVPADADPGEPLRGLAVTDLYLACACGRCDPGAIAAFESRFMRDIDAALGRVRTGEDQRDEVKQALRSQLFTGTENVGPAIGNYSGRGPLSGWVRVAAVRAGCRLVQREQRAGTGQEDLLTALPSPEQGPELELLKARYRSEFKQAFEAAIAALEPRERVLLRLHYVDGLNIDEVGTLYRAHRATVARWIAKARDDITTGTRRVMVEQMHVPRTEYESVMRLIQSQLGVSLSRCLPSVDVIEQKRK